MLSRATTGPSCAASQSLRASSAPRWCQTPALESHLALRTDTAQTGRALGLMDIQPTTYRIDHGIGCASGVHGAGGGLETLALRLFLRFSHAAIDDSTGRGAVSRTDRFVDGV